MLGMSLISPFPHFCRCIDPSFLKSQLSIHWTLLLIPCFPLFHVLDNCQSLEWVGFVCHFHSLNIWFFLIFLKFGLYLYTYKLLSWRSLVTSYLINPSPLACIYSSGRFISNLDVQVLGIRNMKQWYVSLVGINEQVIWIILHSQILEIYLKIPKGI